MDDGGVNVVVVDGDGVGLVSWEIVVHIVVGVPVVDDGGDMVVVIDPVGLGSGEIVVHVVVGLHVYYYHLDFLLEFLFYLDFYQVKL